MLQWLRRKRAERATARELGRRLWHGMLLEACASQGCEHCAKMRDYELTQKLIEQSFEPNGQEALQYAP